jgi:hypothetical protein
MLCSPIINFRYETKPNNWYQSFEQFVNFSTNFLSPNETTNSYVAAGDGIKLAFFYVEREYGMSKVVLIIT